MPVSRRRFLEQSAAALLGTAPLSLPLGAPSIRRSAVEPVVIASQNGNWYRNGGAETCVERAWRLMTGGGDVLDALIAGVNLVELDPAEDGVGYGGLPNTEGVVQLDSCCMHGPRRRAGGVAALEGVRTPSRVAQAVMEHTQHHLLVGSGAREFARKSGFTIEADLNSEHSRKAWREWKRRTAGLGALEPRPRARAERAVTQALYREGLINSRLPHGTITCQGINARGEICGVTSTSGLAWKIPGRVGDSPILGAGLYVDGAVGAVGSTGLGEANLYNLSCFVIVENLRRGMHPKDAGMDALERVRRNTEPRLRRANGDPNFGLTFFVLNASGEHAGVSLYGRDDGLRGWAGNQDDVLRYAVCDRNGPRNIPCEALLPGKLGVND